MTSSAPVNAVDQALATIARYGRSDLQARLQQTRARLLDEQVRVLVVGEFKQGKSLLVNGLVKAPVCPVHDDVATSVPTVVRHASNPVAALVRLLDDEGDGDPDQRRTERIEVPIDKLAEHVSESRNPGNRERWSYAEVGLPRPILTGGLELVDTPGVGGLNSVHGAATMAMLPSADAVLLVSDASQEYTRPELEFLSQAAKVCPNVACVLTKIDLYPEWRRIAELNRAHLATMNIDAELLAVSSTLRVQSIRAQDDDLDAESGFPVLIRYLREHVVSEADLLARRSTVHDVLVVTQQLAGGLRAEQLAQRDPATAQGLIKQLTEAQQLFAALKERSARWQHTLSDGITDLTADIDFDLNDRMREILRQAEEEMDREDPTKTWGQLSTWVEQEVASAISANLVWATQRARWLATRVADHFSEQENQLLPKLRTEVADVLGSVRAMQLRNSESFGIGQKALTTLRGGYVGFLMCGMLGTFVGLAMLNPFSVGAGLALGGKTLKDERRRVITRRQQEAKSAVRRYIDDVKFQASKESRDMLRRVQRDLRDHFTTQADEMNRSLGDSVRAAEKSVKISKVDRERRFGEINSELEQLETLQQRVRTLVPQGTRALAGRE
ncbi:MAG TPA: dynamin family protein [Pseudonocardiaceae bacterium]|nr:dynamin family protein [Pseudonocardiaceae bacterium]